MEDASKIIVAETPVLLPPEASKSPRSWIGINFFPCLGDARDKVAELKLVERLAVERFIEDTFSPSDVAVSCSGMPLENPS